MMWLLGSEEGMYEVPLTFRLSVLGNVTLGCTVGCAGSGGGELPTAAAVGRAAE